MPIEKHKYDPFSDPKLACLFFLPYSQLNMCKEKCQNHAIYCRNIENYNILSEIVKIWKKNKKSVWDEDLAYLFIKRFR